MCACRLDTSRDDLRVRNEALEREAAELQHRNEELTSLAQEAQALKDEMDILRYSRTFISLLFYAVFITKYSTAIKGLHSKPYEQLIA